MTRQADRIAPLRGFIADMSRLVDSRPDEDTLLRQARPWLTTLVADDGWLPDPFAQSDAATYRQYLLYCDPLERFSVVSFVWGPGQKTPIHDHTVWGLVGVLRGEELCAEYQPAPDGRIVSRDRVHRLRQGMVEAVSPRLGDWHVVANALPDQPSISIHVYGGNIGRLTRHRADSQTGQVSDFVSGYSLDFLPSLWPA